MKKKTTDELLTKETFTRKELIKQNMAFSLAMLKARNRGLEHFTVGTVVDDSAFFPVRYHPDPRFSSVSSSAGMCADEISAKTF